MNNRQEGKLVTYICPTCGTALKFENDKKTTICPSCKNEVEKQYVVNINFANSNDNSEYNNLYTYDKSLFKFNFEDKNNFSNDVKKREFIEIPSQKLSPNDILKLDSLIQELLFKMDNPNKIKDTTELKNLTNEILCIDENNIYGVFISNYLLKNPLSEILSRRDSLDKSDFIVPYLMTTNKILYRYYDSDINQIIIYVLNSNIKTNSEKFDCIENIIFEHLFENHYFNEFTESIFTFLNCDFPLQLKQNFVKKLLDTFLLNDYNSFIKYIQLCVNLNLNIDCLFSKNKLKCYIYGFNGNVISKIINFLWSIESISNSKKTEYTFSILNQLLYVSPKNLSAQECASLINSLKDKTIKTSKLSKYFQQIVTLSMIEKEDVDNIKKLENNKIKKQIKLNKRLKPTEITQTDELWSFWKDYWWNKPFKICCLISFIVLFSTLIIFNIKDIAQYLKIKDFSEVMSLLGLSCLCCFILFIPLGALLNTLIAPIKWLTLLIKTKSIINSDEDFKIVIMNNRKNALIMKAEKRNKDLKVHEEFENARLIAYLIETQLDEKIKKKLIDLIKLPYLYESYDEVLNLIDLINRSNYLDKDNLIKFLLLNCININSYKEALTTLEFIKRLSISKSKKEDFTKYLLYKKTKKALTSVTGYLYLISYIDNDIDKFRYMFNIICSYHKDLFFEMNNIDVAYASKEINDDLYLLVCKSVIRFAFSSVNKDHFNELETQIKQKISISGIKDFSPHIKVSNSKIIKWINKKPLNQKQLSNDAFLLANQIK